MCKDKSKNTSCTNHHKYNLPKQPIIMSDKGNPT